MSRNRPVSPLSPTVPQVPFVVSLPVSRFTRLLPPAAVVKQVQNTLTGTAQWSILSIVNSSDRSMTSHSRLVFSRRAVTCLFLLPFSFLLQSAPAQIQQAWAMHYNNGILNGTNQAVKMALDSSGNIYVTGFSQNTNTDLGYVTIKYAPNASQLWATRYDDTNYAAATPSGFALDKSNNVVVTGNALTIKYDTNGNQFWTAPYDGAGIAVDSAGNAIVTGFSSGFNTAKLSPTGSNLWTVSYVSPEGPAGSQALVVDGGGNIYVAGWDTYVCYQEGTFQECNEGLLTAKYDSNGNQLWINIPQYGLTAQIGGMTIDNASNVYVLEYGYDHGWQLFSVRARWRKSLGIESDF